VRRQADRLRAGLGLDPALLGNAFARPLFALRPEIATIQHAMYAAGAPFVALSGAGPSHYTYVAQLESALAIAARLEAGLGALARVLVCEPVAGAAS
jgi:4-diphosphocytidyl-2C-methyl-D-erythritol kinase